MKIEDFPLVVVNGVRTRLMPELPLIENKSHLRCQGCIAWPLHTNNSRDFNSTLCKELTREDTPPCHESEDHARKPRVYVLEDKFQEYVVEFVRRRIS